MQKVEEYEYDEAMEPSYRKSMLKSFVKTLEEGFFPMVVVDAVNHRVREGGMGEKGGVSMWAWDLKQ